MTCIFQPRTLVEMAVSIALLFQAEGPNARMAHAYSGIQTVDASKSEPHDASGRHSIPGNDGPRVVVASVGPLVATHVVVLSWKASVPSSSSPRDTIKGYIVHRSTQSNDRGAQPIHTGFVPGTSCTDDLVENGQTYFYVVRAVNQIGTISGPSNEAKAVIPKDAGPGPVSASPFLLCRDAGKER